mgnify:CR=1 FL=1
MKVKTAIKQAPVQIGIGIFFLLVSIAIYYFFEKGFLHFISIITLIFSIIGIIIEVIIIIHLKNKVRENPEYLDQRL